jgi:hypothetical protein
MWQETISNVISALQEDVKELHQTFNELIA